MAMFHVKHYDLSVSRETLSDNGCLSTQKWPFSAFAAIFDLTEIHRPLNVAPDGGWDSVSESINRAIVTFHGEVQGVGFRFTVTNIARSFPNITGYVQNLSDGAVVLAAEGDKQDIERFISAISSSMNEYIRNTTQTWENGSRQHSRFSVRF